MNDKNITPSLFMSETPPARTIGSECEYNLQNLDVDGNSIDLSKYIVPKAVEAAGLTRVGYFLSNGGKLYLDVGHIEYDTPECLGPKQAAAADLAGMVVMQHIINGSGQPHRGLYRLAGTYMAGKKDYQGSLVLDGRTSGYHENYLIPRIMARDGMIDKLIPAHLVSRIWAMGGAIKVGGYEYSQKADGIGGPPITRVVERRTKHGSKPMAMIPSVASDEDTIGSPHWSRLEVRFGDPTTSPTTRYLGFAATSLVLRMVEQQERIGTERLNKLELADPVLAAYLFSSDLSLNRTVETTQGSRLSLINIQEELATIAIELSNVIELPEDEKEAAHLWLNIVEQLKKSSPHEAKYGELLKTTDVAAKHFYLMSKHTAEEISTNNNNVLNESLAWDRTLPEGGGMKWWRHFPSPIKQEDVDTLVSEAPPTRAAIRALLINDPAVEITSMNWAQVEVKGRGKIKLRDPYQNTLAS